jgi:hypothetical protein
MMLIADFLKQGVAWRKKQTLENQNMLKSWPKKFFRPVSLPIDLVKALFASWRNGGSKKLKNILGIIFAFCFIGYIAFTLVAIGLTVFFMVLDSVMYGQILVVSKNTEPLWRVVVNLIVAHPIIPIGGDVGVLINSVIYYWIVVWIVSLVFAAYEWIRGTGNIASKYISSDFRFNDEEYTQAAEALEHWKVAKYDIAVQKYGERIVDILVLSETIYPNKFSKWERAVSINAIKEDREPKDDEE